MNDYKNMLKDEEKGLYDEPDTSKEKTTGLFDTPDTLKDEQTSLYDTPHIGEKKFSKADYISFGLLVSGGCAVVGGIIGTMISYRNSYLIGVSAGALIGAGIYFGPRIVSDISDLISKKNIQKSDTQVIQVNSSLDETQVMERTDKAE